jgi:nucleotide-binding universal stress UspA family protein
LLDFTTAVADFRRARYRAAMQEIMARLLGRSTELLSYEEVRQKLRANATLPRGLQEIPLDAIVGSVGRYADFTRNFLPRRDNDADRWAWIKVAMTGLTGVPPIEVYQVGEAYFVRDGNHRVSVARELGLSHIHAYVTEVRTKVPLSPGTSLDELIVKAEYTDFLEATTLDALRPQADLAVTAPGKYPKLLEHIEVHRYFMGIEQQREIPYAEAVVHWYDEVYLPVVQIFREQAILLDFPERTETDLYLWLGDYRAALTEELGWLVEPEAAAADLAEKFGNRQGNVVFRLGGKFINAVTPADLTGSPPATGQWRRQRLSRRRSDRIFLDILVPLSGEEVGWFALEQAIEVARREDGRLHGLHLVADEAQLASEAVAQVADRFIWRCGEVGLEADFSLAVGNVARLIVERARWTDLVVLNVAHVPPTQPLARLSSGFRTLLRRSPRPLLVTPGVARSLQRALLAYDGGARADEALFVATYAAARWHVPLVVVSVTENGRPAIEALNRAEQYLVEHGVEATYVAAEGEAAAAILDTAATHECDWLLMGGYGRHHMLEVMVGSELDKVLRQADRPVLICG